MKKILCRVYGLWLLSLLVACTSFPYANPPVVTPTSSEVENIATETPPESEIPPTEDSAPKTLRLWLPPQFDPAAETEAGELLRARLESFQKRRPDLILEVRIKATEGQASLLNSLISAHQAAPSVMPDLVALSRPDLERAVKEGILHPIDGLTVLLDDPDWFPYARSLAHIQDSAYGLPFSANLFGLRYIPTEDFPTPTIAALEEQEAQLLFDPDDSQADLSFCLYTAAGIPLQNEEGEASLEEEALTKLFSFYKSELLFPTEEKEQIFPVLWSNDFLNETPADAVLTPIPGPEGITCSLASAWLWTLAGSAPDLQPAAAELAEYLSDSAFLAEWTVATATLPPRPTALAATKESLHQLSLVAQPIPSNDTVKALAEIFRVATLSVVQEQVDPSAAAQNVLENLQ